MHYCRFGGLKVCRATAWLTDVCSGVVRTRAAVFLVPSWLVIGPRAEMSELAMQNLRNV